MMSMPIISRAENKFIGMSISVKYCVFQRFLINSECIVVSGNVTDQLYGLADFIIFNRNIIKENLFAYDKSKIQSTG